MSDKVKSEQIQPDDNDAETGGYIKRTQIFIQLLAQQLTHHPAYKDRLNGAVIEILGKAAPLHDIGNVGFRNHILLKPGSLCGLNTQPF